jgi:hypothetical protein
MNKLEYPETKAGIRRESDRPARKTHGLNFQFELKNAGGRRSSPIDGTRVYVQSTFERPSTGLSDPDTAGRLASLKILALYCCKSGAYEARYRLTRKAVNEHGRVGDTERNVGKQLKRATLLRAEMTFLRKASHQR